MPNQVCTDALLQCTFGMAPSSFVATPKTIMTSNMDAGHILDNVPIANIPPFGMCSSLANPAVAAATLLAGGKLTPMPCVPVFPAPWIPGAPTVLLANIPALDNTCKLMCAFAGVVSIAFPGQVTHLIP
jgi:hypothetical protein